MAKSRDLQSPGREFHTYTGPNGEPEEDLFFKDVLAELEAAEAEVGSDPKKTDTGARARRYTDKHPQPAPENIAVEKVADRPPKTAFRPGFYGDPKHAEHLAEAQRTGRPIEEVRQKDKELQDSLRRAAELDHLLRARKKAEELAGKSAEPKSERQRNFAQIGAEGVGEAVAGTELDDIPRESRTRKEERDETFDITTQAPPLEMSKFSDPEEGVREVPATPEAQKPQESFVVRESAAPAPKRTKKPAKTSEELSDKDLDPALSAAPQKPSFLNRWKTSILTGVAVVAGIFGVKLGFDSLKDTESKAQGTTSALSSPDSYRQPHKLNERTPRAEAESPAESRTMTYNAQSGDTPWGIIDQIVEKSGVPDDSGELTLEMVRALRRANHLEGDAAKHMHIGQALDLTSAYEILDLAKWGNEAPSPATSYDSSPAPRQAHQVNERAPRQEKSSTATVSGKTSRDTGVNRASLESTKTHDTVPAALLQNALGPDETIWLRGGRMLEALGLKPNAPKQAVLAAIVLNESQKTEAQAMRIRANNDPKWDPSKDFLLFNQAAKATVDLKNGMSPSEVAKKYGVEDVYTKLRDR